MELLRAQKVSFTYPGTKRFVVRDLNLHIEQGETVAVIGKSGCGKTTLLRLLAGFMAPTTGEMHKDPGVRLSFVFQDARLLPWMRVGENIAVAIRHDSKAEQTRKVGDVLARVELSDAINDYPETLSGGMAQRVALARALVVTPDLMLMDEPFASLDAITKSALQDDFLKIKKTSNLSAVLVTHDVFEAVKLADRVFVMSEGALDSEVNLRDLTDIERFERAKALLVRLKNKTRDHEPDRQ